METTLVAASATAKKMSEATNMDKAEIKKS